MTELAPGWEVVARKAHGRIANLLFLALQTLMLSWPPVTYSSITFTVRNRATGETHKVTAKTEDEAALRIAQRQFDRSRARGRAVARPWVPAISGHAVRMGTPGTAQAFAACALFSAQTVCVILCPDGVPVCGSG